MSVKINIKKYIEEYLKIVDKNSKTIDFKLNPLQNKIYEAIKKQAKEKKPIRIIVLKCRQMGASTLGCGIDFASAITRTNVHCGVITHTADTTDNLNQMCKNFYSNLPDHLKPSTNAFNYRNISFDKLNSSINFMTAGSGDGVGVGKTYNVLHISELSRWQWAKETLLPIMQTIPQTPSSIVYIESTAKGFNYFKELCDKARNGENDFEFVFCAWWELPEYERDEEITEYTEDEKELKRLFNLSDRKLAWRRWCIKNNCHNSIDDFHQDYPSTPEEAFLFSGESIFTPTTNLNAILNGKRTPYLNGSFEYKSRYEVISDNDGNIVNTKKIIYDSNFVEKENGFIRIYEKPITKEEKGIKYFNPYVIGVDTAGDGSDYYAAKVINSITGYRCATLHKQNADEKELAEQLYCLGMYYNKAIIGVEINFSISVAEHLCNLDYTNMYRRARYSAETQETTLEVGFRTDRLTKPKAVWDLVELTREHPELEPDFPTIQEMLTFVRDEKGKLGAINGSHDDLVMADAIAEQVNQTQTHTYIVDDSHKFRLENYFNLEKENEEELEW